MSWKSFGTVLRGRVGVAVGLLLCCAADMSAQSQPSFARGWQAGTSIAVSGELTVVHADDFARDRAELMYFVREERTGRTFRLRFEREAPGGLQTGARVTVRGRASGSEIYLASSSEAEVAVVGGSVTTSTANAETDVQRTLVIVANLRDASVSCSPQAIGDVMFADPNGVSVANLYHSTSLGRVLLSGDVVGPYVLDASSTDTCDIGALSVAADAQAATAGVDVASYRRRVYVLPRNQCNYAGLATMGGNPSRAWIFQCDVKGVYSHELGHNLGMHHAATPAGEYGDSTDPMAIAGSRIRGVNAPHRHQLGWHRPESVVEVRSDGLYDVAPLGLDPSAATAPQILMIAKPDTGDYYYLSYRLPIGFDQYIDGVFYERLSVHKYKGDRSSSLTYRLAGLADGETFVDEVNGISVTLISHGSTHATASIAFTGGAAVAAPPALAVTPDTQSGAAGTSLSYVLSVTNQDPPTASPSTFSVNGSVPAGWGAAVEPAALTIPPGATAVATLTVTAPSNAAPGSYRPGVRVEDRTHPVHAAADDVTFTVVSQGDSSAPTAPGGLRARSSQKAKQVQLSWTASTDNVGVEGYRIWRNGVLAGYAATTDWSESISAGATHTYFVEAYDAAGNVSPPSNSASASLAGGKGK